jgi:hypothetical protein
MSHLDHGNFETLLTLFPKIKILESASEWKEVQEDATQLIPSIPDSRIIVLSGFFQNSENFPKSSELMPRLPQQKFQENARRWAIHFRFGDYAALQHYHVDLSKYYFYTITKFIPKGSKIVLFSDTPRLQPIADEIRSMGYEVLIYDNPDTLATLHAFAACGAGAICSNSTFSWWAAYFASADADASSEYKAYFPSRWMKHSTPNLFTLPFTQTICLDSIYASPQLKTFSHY